MYDTRLMQVGIFRGIANLRNSLQLSYEIIFNLSLSISSEKLISYFDFFRLVDCSLDLLAETCTNEELFEISQPDYLTVDMMKQVKNDLRC